MSRICGKTEAARHTRVEASASGVDHQGAAPHQARAWRRGGEPGRRAGGRVRARARERLQRRTLDGHRALPADGRQARRGAHAVSIELLFRFRAKKVRVK